MAGLPPRLASLAEEYSNQQPPAPVSKKSSTRIDPSVVNKGMQSAADFLGAGSLIKTARAAVAGSSFDTLLKPLMDAGYSAQQASLELAKKAKVEKDPVKKQELLAASRSASGAGSTVSDTISGFMETEAPTDMDYGQMAVGNMGNAFVAANPLKYAVGSGPVGAVANRFLPGFATSAVSSITDPSTPVTGEKIKDSISSGVAGGVLNTVVGGVGEKVYNTIDNRLSDVKAVEKAKKRLAVLFAGGKDMQSFRKNFAVKDAAGNITELAEPEKIILENDLPNLVNKKPAEMTKYFHTKMVEANKTLKQLSKTDAPFPQMTEVGTKVNELAAEVSRNPFTKMEAKKIRRISDVIAANPNPTTRDVDDLIGALTELAPPGRDGTKTQTMIKELAAQVREMRNAAVPGIKEANMNSRLYSILAKRSGSILEGTKKKEGEVIKALFNKLAVGAGIGAGAGLASGNPALGIGVGLATTAGMGKARDVFTNPTTQLNLADKVQKMAPQLRNINNLNNEAMQVLIKLGLINLPKTQ